MNEDVLAKFIGKNVEAEIEQPGHTFVVKGELSWDDLNSINGEINKVTIAGEDKAISVLSSQIVNICVEKKVY